MRSLADRLKKYSLAEIIRLIFYIIHTKLILPNARLIRFPIDIRGKKNIEFGSNLTTGYNCRLETYSANKIKVLKIGKNVQINDFVHIVASKSVVIGDNVLIASKVFISDALHGSYKGDAFDSDPLIPPINRSLSASPVFIDENVWIGEFVSVLPGVKIGKSSIIGSNSVVTKNIPDFSIAVGNPARVIKKYNFNTKRWEAIF
ncbi:putative lipopolysaccharide biosynthesis O-acetyl transferase WbbJ [Spirochaetia bacterium]|nr:putative lipopolysaccharide biosynthesis O-acetyl transferase WbbJ [Spirochaetia bacterium]